MPSRQAIVLLVVTLVNGNAACQRAAAAGAEHFEIRGADGKVLIGADDVLAYEWASHTLTLKPKVRKNLFDELKRNLVHGEPFVVAVGGKVVYHGNWKSVASSIACARPVIVLDRQAVDPKLGEDQVRIELGYPSKKFSKGDDPRGDQRIRKALEASGKLKQGKAIGYFISGLCPIETPDDQLYASPPSATSRTSAPCPTFSKPWTQSCHSERSEESQTSHTRAGSFAALRMTEQSTDTWESFRAADAITRITLNQEQRRHQDHQHSRRKREHTRAGGARCR